MSVSLSPLIRALQAPHRLILSDTNGSSAPSARKLMWRLRQKDAVRDREPASSSVTQPINYKYCACLYFRDPTPPASHIGLFHSIEIHPLQKTTYSVQGGHRELIIHLSLGVAKFTTVQGRLPQSAIVQGVSDRFIIHWVYINSLSRGGVCPKGLALNKTLPRGLRLAITLSKGQKMESPCPGGGGGGGGGSNLFLHRGCTTI